MPSQSAVAEGSVSRISACHREERGHGRNADEDRILGQTTWDRPAFEPGIVKSEEYGGLVERHHAGVEQERRRLEGGDRA